VAGLGAVEVCSSTKMGALGASHLGMGDHGPKTDRSRPRSVLVNALVFTNRLSLAWLVALPDKWFDRNSLARLRRLPGSG
jgi:hypothetical protein